MIYNDYLTGQKRCCEGRTISGTSQTNSQEE